jgi:multicomponent Na+:H+ antiporter subunit F
MNLEIVLIAMIAALLIPIYEVWKTDNTWQLMLGFGSISSKVSIIILMISVIRDDWMIGVVAVIILSVGNAGFMLLAHILRRLIEEQSYPH